MYLAFVSHPASKVTNLTNKYSRNKGLLGQTTDANIHKHEKRVEAMRVATKVLIIIVQGATASFYKKATPNV